MLIEKREGQRERRILIGMIVDSSVLSRISEKWTKEGLFQSKWSNLLGSWCVEFYKRYEKAPNQAIESIFESWATTRNRDPKTVGMIEKLLSSLSNDYKTLKKESNSNYIIDMAASHFNEVRLRNLAEQINGNLQIGDIPAAQKVLDDSQPLELGIGGYVDVFQDHNAIREAFENGSETLLTYPGDLGRFYGHTFSRDSLVAFLAPEKRGKSFHLMNLAYLATLERRRVAYFEVGDMSQNQVLKRLAVRITKQPLRPRKVKWPKTLTIDHANKIPELTYEELEFTKELSWQTAWKTAQQIMAKKIKSKDSYFRLCCYPNSSISILGVRDKVLTWIKQGWWPDFIVIDYADILAPISMKDDSRNQINATWKRMRSLSQETHSCVVTATQSDAASYKAYTLSQSNFSDDKRKAGHVTDMIGLNQTEEEKELGVYRHNRLFLRDDEFVVGKCVWVASCLALANPCVRSSF